MRKLKNILKSIMAILFFIGCVTTVMSAFAIKYESAEKAHYLTLISLICMAPTILYGAWRCFDDPGDLPF